MITEVLLDEKVTAFRAQLSPGMFLEPSFPTIAGVNGNGAIVHYRYVIKLQFFNLLPTSVQISLRCAPSISIGDFSLCEKLTMIRFFLILRMICTIPIFICSYYIALLTQLQSVAPDRIFHFIF